MGRGMWKSPHSVWHLGLSANGGGVNIRGPGQGAERGVGGRSQGEAQGMGWAAKGPRGPGLSSWLCRWQAG